MIRLRPLLVCFFAVVLAWSPAAFAEPGPELPRPIDWRDFVDHDSDGDHVVGEEMCALPGIGPIRVTTS